MRLKPVIIFAGLVTFAACKSAPEPAPSRHPTITVTVQTNTLENPNPQVTRAVEALNGRVVSVNNQLRFVVVDFLNQRMPRLEQKLAVYHFDQKVAELKVSGPFLGTTVAADVTAGEAQPGDLVRNER